MRRRAGADAGDDDMPISENGYDDETVELIEGLADGLILDVGAGYRPVYYSNVVNFEMMDYATTDVVGVAHRLPFKDDVFRRRHLDRRFGACEGSVSLRGRNRARAQARRMAQVLRALSCSRCMAIRIIIST